MPQCMARETSRGRSLGCKLLRSFRLALKFIREYRASCFRSFDRPIARKLLEQPRVKWRGSYGLPGDDSRWTACMSDITTERMERN